MQGYGQHGGYSQMNSGYGAHDGVNWAKIAGVTALGVMGIGMLRAAGASARAGLQTAGNASRQAGSNAVASAKGHVSSGRAQIAARAQRARQYPGGKRMANVTTPGGRARAQASSRARKRRARIDAGWGRGSTQGSVPTANKGDINSRLGISAADIPGSVGRRGMRSRMAGGRAALSGGISRAREAAGGAVRSGLSSITAAERAVTSRIAGSRAGMYVRGAGGAAASRMRRASPTHQAWMPSSTGLAQKKPGRIRKAAQGAALSFGLRTGGGSVRRGAGNGAAFGENNIDRGWF